MNPISFPRALGCLVALSIAGSLTAQVQPSELPSALDVTGAIRYALDHNYAILQAREQIKQQEGVLVQVTSRSIPNVAVNSGYSKNSSSVATSNPQVTSDYSVQLQASQVLFSGGGVQASIKQAKFIRDAAAYDLEAVINQSILQVRSVFYNVLLAREKIKVQEENIGLYTRQLEDAQNQLNSGIVSNFEVLRAQVALANQQPGLITARNDYRVAIEQLRQVMGVPSGPRGSTSVFPEISGTLDYTPETFDLDSTLAQAHDHRPELLSLQSRSQSGQQAVIQAKSTYYPSLSAVGTYEWVGLGFAHGSSVSKNGWLVGLQSSWAIFDGRATEGKIRQARSFETQSRLGLESEQLVIDVEVRQALSALEEANELVTASKKTVELAEESLRLAQVRYHTGKATQLDVLTSQVDLTVARTNVLKANYSYSIALATLHKAIGAVDITLKN
jgi:outer membrane protein TolC